MHATNVKLIFLKHILFYETKHKCFSYYRICILYPNYAGSKFSLDYLVPGTLILLAFIFLEEPRMILL